MADMDPRGGRGEHISDGYANDISGKIQNPSFDDEMEFRAWSIAEGVSAGLDVEVAAHAVDLLCSAAPELRERYELHPRRAALNTLLARLAVTFAVFSRRGDYSADLEVRVLLCAVERWAEVNLAQDEVVARPLTRSEGDREVEQLAVRTIVLSELLAEYSRR